MKVSPTLVLILPISFVTSITLLNLTLSCAASRPIDSQTLKEKEGDIKICSLRKTNGDKIIFHKRKPGIIVEDSIVGGLAGESAFNKSDIKSEILDGEFVDDNGNIYYLLKEIGWGSHYLGCEKKNISLSEVDKVYLCDSGQWRTGLVIISGIVFLLIILAAWWEHYGGIGL
jgi:hypothetical protein